MAAGGPTHRGGGPNERIGRAQDREVAAREEARDAAAASLTAQGKQIKREADVEATRLDEQSKALHEAPNENAAALR